MTYAELVQLYFERSSALQGYWTLYVVIIGGLLAFSSLRQRRDMVTGILVTVLFCFFAYKNLGAIHDVTEQRMAIREAVAKQAQANDTLLPTLVTPDYEGIRNFHVTSDVITVLALWAMELRRIRYSKEPAKTA